MSCNYSSFSSNAIKYGSYNTPTDDTQNILLQENDQLQSLKIRMVEWTCKEEDGENVPLDEWDSFDLRRLSRLTFFFGEIGEDTVLFQGDCFIADARTGFAYFSFPEGSLDDLEGDYIGYIKAYFDSGRTVTATNKILFTVVKNHEFLP